MCQKVETCTLSLMTLWKLRNGLEEGGKYLKKWCVTSIIQAADSQLNSFKRVAAILPLEKNSRSFLRLASQC